MIRAWDGDADHVAPRHAIQVPGREDFKAGIAITDPAEKTMDRQDYIWEPETTGRILAERLVRTADRGLRVRVLLDDINLQGRDRM